MAAGLRQRAEVAVLGPRRRQGPGLAGKAQVLDESRPRSGQGLVARVQIPFASVDGFAVYEARKAPQTTEEVVLAGRRTVVGGAARLRLAEDKARADDAAAEQAVKAVSTNAPLSKAAAGRSGRGHQGPRNGHEGGEGFPGGGKPVGPAERQETSAKRELTRAEAQPTSVSEYTTWLSTSRARLSPGRRPSTVPGCGGNPLPRKTNFPCRVRGSDRNGAENLGRAVLLWISFGESRQVVTALPRGPRLPASDRPEAPRARSCTRDAPNRLALDHKITQQVCW